MWRMAERDTTLARSRDPVSTVALPRHLPAKTRSGGSGSSRFHQFHGVARDADDGRRAADESVDRREVPG